MARRSRPFNACKTVATLRDAALRLPRHPAMTACGVESLPWGAMRFAYCALRATRFIHPDLALLLGQWESNDECEQFNHGDSDHQGCECYRIVIEPITPLYIHDAPPYSSNSREQFSRIANRCRLVLFLHFELLHEGSDVRGDWSRESVVLGLEAIADRRQPNASTVNRNPSAPRGRVRLRSPDRGRYARERRLLRCR